MFQTVRSFYHVDSHDQKELISPCLRYFSTQIGLHWKVHAATKTARNCADVIENID
jgi:hypothetical protein